MEEIKVINRESEDCKDSREDFENKKEKMVRTRPVYRRTILVHVLGTLFISFFSLFWAFEIDKESKSIAKRTDDTSSCKVVIFSIITFGIYLLYWMYKVGKRQSEYFIKNGEDRKSKLSRKYLLIGIFGIIASVVLVSVLTFYIDFGLHDSIKQLFNVFCITPVFFVPFAVVLGMMQSNNHKMLAKEFKKGRSVLVRNSDLLNKVFWGTVFLFLGAQILVAIFDTLGLSISTAITGNNAALDSLSQGTDDALQLSIQQGVECNELYVLLPNVMSILGGLVAMLVMYYWFRHGKYTGVLKARRLGKALLLCLPSFIMCFLNVLSFIIDGDCNFQFGLIVLGFVPGVTEEVIFRGLIIPNFMRIFNDKLGIYVSLIVSSLLFGLVHTVNLAQGADFGTTMYQVFYATALGSLFAAVLIRTGNLCASIICHSLIDILALMSPAALEQGSIQTQAFTWDLMTIIMVVFYCAMIAYSAFLCRPKKHDEILSLWRARFGKAMLQTI